MKKLFFLIVAISIMLSGCSFIFTGNPVTEYESPYATDINGEFVPVHDDVDESVLDPKLFYTDENIFRCSRLPTVWDPVEYV